MAGQWSAARTGKPWPPHCPGSLQADTAWPRGPVNRGRFARKQEDVVCQGRGPGFCKPPGPPVALWVQPDSAPPRARPPGMPRTGGAAQACEVRSLGGRAGPGPARPPVRLHTGHADPLVCRPGGGLSSQGSCEARRVEVPVEADVAWWPCSWLRTEVGRSGCEHGQRPCHKSGAVQCAEQRARQLAGRAGTWPSSDFLRLEDQVTPPGEKCDG